MVLLKVDLIYPLLCRMVDVGHACPGGDVLWGEINLMNDAKICSEEVDLCANGKKCL